VTKRKRYFIKTFGCQANVADSERLSSLLNSLGYERYIDVNAKDNKEIIEKVFPHIDLFIINSCSVRQKSEDKVYGFGKLVLKMKKRPKIVLTGCMVGSARGDRKRYDIKSLENRTKFVDYYLRSGLGPGRAEPGAYINISSGCDNFCTYCVVPYARGKETSRSRGDILEDITKSIDFGITEILLCGQNVNSWGLSKREKFNIRVGSKQKLPFADLLRKIHKLEGIKKIEFISSNPFDFTQDLVEVFRLPKISNYLHIAVQSGNNDILTKMNRRHTIEEFINLINSLRFVRPSIEIGTDAIVGFPGETKTQFMDTVNLFKKVKFPVAFISMYSPREGTFAKKKYKNDVSLKEKKRRHFYLTKIWKQNKP